MPDFTLVTILGTLLFALVPAQAATYTGEFATCSSYTPAYTAIANQPNAATCATECYTQTGNIYTNYYSNTQICRCTNVSPYPGSAQIATGNPGGCGSNAEVWVTHTTFDFVGCSQAYNWGSTAIYGSGDTDIETIFGYCKSYSLMAIYATNGQYLWACGNGAFTSTTPVTCGLNTNRLYTHPADATASHLAKRDTRRRLDEARFAMPRYCPKGFSACLVDASSDSYECLDTESELEACGGCLFGLFRGEAGGMGRTTSATNGTDCSSLPGVAVGGVTCTLGRCVVSACDLGWHLVGDLCEQSL